MFIQSILAKNVFSSALGGHLFNDSQVYDAWYKHSYGHKQWGSSCI